MIPLDGILLITVPTIILLIGILLYHQDTMNKEKCRYPAYLIKSSKKGHHKYYAYFPNFLHSTELKRFKFLAVSDAIKYLEDTLLSMEKRSLSFPYPIRDMNYFTFEIPIQEGRTESYSVISVPANLYKIKKMALKERAREQRS